MDIKDLRVEVSLEPHFGEGEDLTISFVPEQNLVRLRINVDSQYKVMAARKIIGGVLLGELDRLVEQHLQIHAGNEINEKDNRESDTGNLLVTPGDEF